MKNNSKAGAENSTLLKLILAGIFCVLGLFLITSIFSEAEAPSTVINTQTSGSQGSSSQNLERFSSNPELVSLFEISGISANTVSFVESIGTRTEEDRRSITSQNNEILSNMELDIEARERLNTELNENRNLEAIISTRAELFRFTFNNGEVRDYTKITRTVVLQDSARSSLYDYRVMEVVPKDVVSSASRYMFGDFRILVDDPLIAFEIPDRRVQNDQIVIEYVVEGDVLDSSTQIETAVVGVESSSQVQRTGVSDQNMILLIVLMLLILGAILYLHMRRH